jgi:hypothetical protein
MGKTIELAISEVSLPVSGWDLFKNAKFSHIRLKLGNDFELPFARINGHLSAFSGRRGINMVKLAAISKVSRNPLQNRLMSFCLGGYTYGTSV